MSNENTRRKLRLLNISLLAVTVFVLCLSEVSKPHHNRISARIIKNTGTILYADIPPPPPSGGTDFLAWLIEALRTIAAFSGLVVLAKAITRFAEWLSWRAKYDKSRTPIVMPI